MLTIKQLEIADAPLWNNYVSGHEGATAYHYFGWGLACRLAYGHRPYYFAAFEGDTLKGVLPGVAVNKPFKKAELCALPFCDVGGVLADNEEVGNALNQHFIEFSRERYGSNFSLRESVSEKLSDEAIEQMRGLEFKPKVRMLFDLPDDSETLLAGFKSKLRSQIRKAEKNGLSFKISSGIDEVNAFYRVFSINMRNLGSPVHSQKWFESVKEFYKDNFILSTVYFGDVPVGAGIVLTCGNKASIPWASTVPKYNRLSPNMLLYWSLLKEVTDRGCRLFDFGRSSIGEGTYKFKEQWGAQPYPLIWRDKSALNGDKSAPTSQSKLRSVVEQVWQHLPLPLANMAGPFIRKHISL